MNVQYSQRDPRWKDEVLGFGGSGLKIENYGCLVTACSTLLTAYGFPVNPSEMNARLKKIGGFSGALMYTGSLANLFPVRVKMIKTGIGSETPSQLINSMLDKGLLAIVEFDASSRSGFQNHWAVVYKRDGENYFISDPYSKNPEGETITLAERYGFSSDDVDKIVNNVLMVEPTAVPLPIEFPPLVDVGEIPVGEKLTVIVNSLRLRKGPSTGSMEFGYANAGMEFVSAGKPIKDGAITWQPVVVYLAANYGDAPYIKKNS